MLLAGGAFAFACPTFYLEFLHVLRIELSRALDRKVAIFAPFYPLSPESQLDDAASAINDAWKYLSDHPTVDQESLILVGESAGGGLVCDLLCTIAKQGSPYAKVSQAVYAVSLHCWKID